MSIFVDTGSTPMAFARALAGRRHLQLVTNSLDIARLLAPEAGIKVKVTPGWVRANDNAVLGGDTIAFVRRLSSTSRSWGSPLAMRNMVGWTMPRRNPTCAGR